jgi:hypothetical protein
MKRLVWVLPTLVLVVGSHFQVDSYFEEQPAEINTASRVVKTRTRVKAVERTRVKTIHILPKEVQAQPGQFIRFCAVLEFEDGLAALAPESLPYEVCHEHLLAWQSGRQAP